MIIAIYYFIIGWVSVLSLNSWLPLPMIVALLITLIDIFYLFSGRKVNLFEIKIIIIFYLFFLDIVISYLFQILKYGFFLSGLTHMLSYFAAIGAYYFGIFFYVYNKKYSLKKIYKYLSWGVLFVSVFTIVEFILKNYMGIDFDSIIPRISVINFDATYTIAGISIYRARGTASESGHLAMYLSMFIPFIYYYYRYIINNTKKAVLYICAILISILFTFSAMGIAELLIMLVLVITINIFTELRKKIKTSKVLLISCSSIAIVVFIYWVNTKNFNLSFADGIIDKITFANQSVYNEGSRFSRWHNAINLFLESPLIGHGPGIASILFNTGSTSFYLELLAEMGFVGLVLFMQIIIFHFTMALKLKGQIKYIYIISYVVMLMHFFVISNYWFPWMWVLFCLTNLQYLEQKSVNKKSII